MLTIALRRFGVVCSITRLGRRFAPRKRPSRGSGRGCTRLRLAYPRLIPPAVPPTSIGGPFPSLSLGNEYGVNARLTDSPRCPALGYAWERRPLPSPPEALHPHPFGEREGCKPPALKTCHPLRSPSLFKGRQSEGGGDTSPLLQERGPCIGAVASGIGFVGATSSAHQPQGVTAPVPGPLGP